MQPALSNTVPTHVLVNVLGPYAQGAFTLSQSKGRISPHLSSEGAATNSTKLAAADLKPASDPGR